MLLLQPNLLLRTAIEDRRMIRLRYHGRIRILEPHDHGILNGSIQLLAYQVGGSSSRRLPNWMLMKADEIGPIFIVGNRTIPKQSAISEKWLDYGKILVVLELPVRPHTAGYSRSVELCSPGQVGDRR